MIRLFIPLALFVGLLFTVHSGEALAIPVSDAAARIAGRPLAGITFSGSNTLTKKDLLRGLPVTEGRPATLEDLERSIALLFAREVFEDITVDVEESELGPVLHFRCTLRYVVSRLLLRGNTLLDSNSLRRRTGVRNGMGYSPALLDFAQEGIRKAYEAEGYFSVQVTPTVERRPEYADVVIHLEIDEGEPRRFATPIIEGEIREEFRSAIKVIEEHWRGKIASRANLQTLLDDVRTAVRKEGYLQASIRLARENLDEEKEEVTPYIQIRARQPVTISFFGNSVFTPEELLEPLQLRTRKVPFSPNAISSLCEEIELLYQRRGYFFARAVPRVEGEENGRQVYSVLINEGARITLRKVVFVGNQSIPDDELRPILTTRAARAWPLRRWYPGSLVRSDLAGDLAAIEQFYVDKGYPGTEADFDVSVDPTTNEARLEIRIIEAKPQRIRVIRWEGGESVARELAEQDFALQLGEVPDAGKLAAEREKLRARLADGGFPTAEVETGFDSATGELVITLNTGPRVEIRRVLVAGNRRADDAVIRRELKLTPGDFWRADIISSTTSRLLQLGLFSAVSIHPLDGKLDSASEDLVIDVEERESGNVSLEATINTEDGLHLVSELRQRNLEGTGDILSFGVDGYFQGGSDLLAAGRVRSLYNNRRIADSDFDFLAETFLEYSVTTLDAYDFDRVGFSTALHREIWEHTDLTAGHRVFRENLYNVESDVILGEDDTGNTLYSTLFASLAYDQRDDRFQPRDGYLFRLTPEVSARALGSGVDYVGGRVELSFYRELGAELLWTTGTRIAAFEPFGSTEVLPLSRRLFLGGRDTLRGFSRNEVGPRALLGNVVGGDSSLNIINELQYDLTQDVSALLFLDVGQAFLANSGMFGGDQHELSDLRYSPGLGLRYHTPIGPLSVDYGFALDREEGERIGRLNFGIGGTFQ